MDSYSYNGDKLSESQVARAKCIVKMTNSKDDDITTLQMIFKLLNINNTFNLQLEGSVYMNLSMYGSLPIIVGKPSIRRVIRFINKFS